MLCNDGGGQPVRHAPYQPDRTLHDLLRKSTTGRLGVDVFLGGLRFYFLLGTNKQGGNFNARSRDQLNELVVNYWFMF